MPAFVIRLVVAVLLFIHGMAHFDITRLWGSRTTSSSWLFGTVDDGITRVLWVAAIMVFVATALILVLGFPQWRVPAVAGSLLSLGIIVTFYSPIMTLGIVVDVALLVAILVPDVSARLTSLLNV